jgi:hypothetical protein
MSKRRRISPEKLLDYFGSIGASTPTRIVALTIYHSLNGIDPTLELLSFRTGISVEKISDALWLLEEAGVLSYIDERMTLRVPECSVPDVPKKIKENVPAIADEVGEILNEYRRRWIERYKRKCYLTGKDRTRIADLIERIGYRDTKQRLQNYLKSDDAWLVDRCHPLAVFAKTSNSYCRGKNVKAAIIKRDSEFDSEVRRFEEERSGKNDS